MTPAGSYNPEYHKYAIYKWRAKNPEKWSELQIKYHKNYYAKNKQRLTSQRHLMKEFLRLAKLYDGMI